MELHTGRLLGARLVGALAAAAVCVSLVGCKGLPRRSRGLASPVPMRIAVAPFFNLTDQSQLDGDHVADLFASELTRFEDVQIVRPGLVMRVAENEGIQLTGPSRAIDLGKAAEADMIAVAAITEYDPYDNIVGIAIQIFNTRRRYTGVTDVLNLELAGRPFAHSKRSGETPFFETERVFDAHRVEVQEAVKDYAGASADASSALGWREYIVVRDRYFRFVSHEMITDFMEAVERWQKQSKREAKHAE